MKGQGSGVRGQGRPYCAVCWRQINEPVIRADFPGIYFCGDGCYNVHRLTVQQIPVRLTATEMNLILTLLNGPWQSKDPAVTALRDQIGEKLAPIYGRQIDLIAEAKLQRKDGGGG